MTFFKDASHLELLCFWVDTENWAHWILLCPETPKVAGLPDQSPEGTEERQALHSEVYTAFPQSGLPSEASLSETLHFCFLASWILSMTEFTALPKRPEGISGVSSRKNLTFSLISDRFNQRFLSIAIEWPMALAISLVAQRDTSAAICSLHSSSISICKTGLPPSQQFAECQQTQLWSNKCTMDVMDLKTLTACRG